MKLKFLILLSILFCLRFSASSQGGTWTWISGSSIPNSAPVFGTQGVPSVNNQPASGYEYIEWHDRSGNLWLYGGTYTGYSDMWKFNPSTLEWTWVKGSGLIYLSPVYGPQGVFDPSYHPGERALGATTWIDTSGNFWLFGGANGANFCNDLWQFDINLLQWAWMSGSQSGNAIGNHGVQGVPSPSNIPGSRTESVCSWTDSSNNLWIFGGLGYDDTGVFGNLGDLCKYDISTNEWTWMKGTIVVNAPPNHGTKGVSNAANDPGGRFCYSKWKDLQDNLWFFGGFGIDDYNDVWKFNIGINEWTWMSGTNIINNAGNYLGLCIEDTSAVPFSRRENRATISDECGRFWLFGGFQDGSGMLNDLWTFNPVDLKWNLLRGSAIINDPGNFGTMGVPDPANMPQARCGANAWWGQNNKFYVFGGAINNFINTCGDLWVFEPDTNCISPCSPVTLLPVAMFQAPDSICPGTCTDFTNASSNGSSFTWYFTGGVPSVSTDFNPQNICYNSPGNYDVTLVATNSNGSDSITLIDYITVHPYPSPQGILQSGDTLIANAGAVSYQWYYNGDSIAGATNYFYFAQSSGDYNVIATDANGCEVEAVINNVVANTTPLSIGEGSGVRLYPNPVVNELRIENKKWKMGTAEEVSIYNVLGEKIELAVNRRLLTVDCRPLASGMYYIEIKTGNKIFRSKFLKQ